MNESKYQLLENKLNAKDFIRLKVATGFKDRPIEQVYSRKMLYKKIR